MKSEKNLTTSLVSCQWFSSFDSNSSIKIPLKDLHIKLNDDLLIFLKHIDGCAFIYFKKRHFESEVFSNKIFDFVISNKGMIKEIKLVGEEQFLELVQSLLLKRCQFINRGQYKEIVRNSIYEAIIVPSESRLLLTKENNMRINLISTADKSTLNNKPVLKNAEAHMDITSKVRKKIKVLIVDDSKLIQTILRKICDLDSSLEVIGVADRPSAAEEIIKKNRPDVMTLDIHMPEQDGVAYIKESWPRNRIPTIMISSLSIDEGGMVLDALENGAVDYIQKPSLEELDEVGKIIIEKIKCAAEITNVKTIDEMGHSNYCSLAQNYKIDVTKKMVVIGSSTGGTEALREILCCLPSTIPPVLIVQHIPPVFSKAFAMRMNELCSFTVKEAEDGDRINENCVYVAPGGKQMAIKKLRDYAVIHINDDPPVNRFKPSVDYLFKSVCKHLYRDVVAVILTGMGKDGAQGMKELHSKGVKTIAQSEKSCVVFGMPREAIAQGAVDIVSDLDQIALNIMKNLN